MSVEWIDHKGKRILYADYRQCTSEEEMLQVLEEQGKQLRLRSSKSLLLSNVEGATIGSAFMNEVKRRGAKSGDLMLEKNAFLGVTGLKGILLDGYISVSGLRGKVRAFDTEAAALDWLAD